MEILKLTQTSLKDEPTWVALTEYPNNMIVIEGVRADPKSNGRDMLSQRIMLSKEALELIVPSLVKWLESKK